MGPGKARTKKNVPKLPHLFVLQMLASTQLVTNLFAQSLDQQHHIEMRENAIGNPVMDKHQTHHLTLVERCMKHGTCIEQIYPMSIKIKIRDLSSSPPKPCILEGDFETDIPIFEWDMRETYMPQLTEGSITHPMISLKWHSSQLLRLEKVGARTVRSPLMTFFLWDMAFTCGPFSMNGLLPENAQFQKNRGWVELLNTWSTEQKCVI